MVFSSLTFLFSFLPIFLILYFCSPNKFKNFILFLFSLVFYAWGEPVYIILMIISTVFDYINGRLIEKFGHNTTKSKIVLIISIIGNLCLLGVFKYLDFILININSIFNTNIELLGVALPIGISFYTFQTMSYTIDVYKGIVKAQHNIINLGAYVAMFPQLIAGPIVQYKTVEQELNNRKISYEDIYVGVKRFCIGFIKKVFLANNIGFVWNEISMNYTEMSALTLWLGIVCYAFQIYFDFSGYSDMAIGLGRILGFKFLENFNYPYISKSITEFWRRWHISLGNWFREYVYIPLGGNRKGLKRQIFNISVVWLLTGIWHGANWNYLFWGIYYGILLIIEKIFLLKKLEKLPNIISHIYSIFVILIGWCIFALEDINILINYLKGLFINMNGIVNIDTFYYLQNYGLLIIICIFSSINLLQIFKKEDLQDKTWFITVKNIGILIMFILSLAMLVNSTYNPFLYFRF